MVAATNGNTNVINDPVYKQCMAAGPPGDGQSSPE
jgi:hypothetical protein